MPPRRPIAPPAAPRGDPGVGTRGKDGAATRTTPGARTPTGSPSTGTAAGRGTTAAPRTTASPPRSSTPSRPVSGTRPAPGTRPTARRPGTSARSTSTARSSDPGLRRPALVRPFTMLMGTLVILTLLLAPALKPWIEQRSALAQMREDVATTKKDVDALTTDRNQWRDPDYVRAQARERLNFVLPGQTRYVVIDDRPKPQPTDPSRAAAAVASTRLAWFGDLWRSVEVAGDPKTVDSVGGPPATP